MKIAYIVPALIQAGNVCVARDLADLMVQHGHQCVVYYFDDKPSAYEFPCPTKRIGYFESIPFDDFDIIHAHALRPDMYCFFMKPLHCKAKFVCTIHNYVFPDAIYEHGPIIGPIEGLVDQICRYRFDYLLVLTLAHFDYYAKWYSKRIMSVVYNTRVLRRDLDICQEDKLFFDLLRQKFNVICASICGVTERKGLDQVIKALPFVSKDMCYVIIGDGPALKSLKQLTSRLSLNDRVFFLGNRSNGYLYMPFIDVFCIPSHSEGFPLAMLEAASYGKAMVSSDLPLFKEVFSDSECVICKENDIESIAEGLMIASNDMEKLGMNALKRYELEYSPESFYQKHISVYNSLLK